MKHQETHHIHNVAPLPISQALAALVAHTEVEPADVQQGTLIGLDTFDERLGAAGLVCEVLASTHQDYHLRLREVRTELCRWQYWLNALPRFATELPPTTWPRRIGQLLGERALIPKSQIEITRHSFVKRSASGKVVYRVAVDVSAPHFVVRFVPVTGYTDHRRATRALLASVPQLETATADALSYLANAASGAGPVVENKPTFAFPAHVGASSAISAVLLAYWQVMRATEIGIVERIDIEFLHDYRIALRRTRVLLCEYAKHYPPTEVKHFRHELKHLGMLTGRARDLDVIESTLDNLLQDSDFAPNDREILRVAVIRARSLAYEQLQKHFASDRHKRVVRDWPAFLNSWTPAANEPLMLDLLARSIKRSVRKIRCNPWLDDVQAEMRTLHKLRIETKRLRYIIDAFNSLLPHKGARAALKYLKAIQECTGRACDLEAQQELLGELYAGQAVGDPQRADLEVAVKALQALLERRHKSASMQVPPRLRKLKTAKIAAHFKQLYRV